MDSITRKDVVTSTLENSDLRRTPDGRVSVFDLLKAAGAKNPHQTWETLSTTYPDTLHFVESVKLPRKDGKKANTVSPVTTAEGWDAILMVLPGLLGNKFRKSSLALVTAFKNNPAQVAAAAIERVTDKKEAAWLGARAFSKSTCLDLNEAASKAGISERTFAKIHDTNNVAITGMTAREIQTARGVKQTCDGFNMVELGLMIAAQGAEAERITNENVQGDGAVLGIVADVSNAIAGVRKQLVGVVKQPYGALLQVTQ